MSRRQDLEGHIRESYDIIHEYEAMIRTSDRPEERLRARRAIEGQWALIEGYVGEYQRLAGDALPADIAEIAVSLSTRKEPGPASPRSAPAADTAYHVHIERATGLAIGDGARVVQLPAERSRERTRDVQLSAGTASGAASAGWSRETLRQLLLAAFRDQDLMALCFDHFGAVYEDLSAEMGAGEKVQRLLEYCVRYGQVDKLLGLVREQNPVQYERFASRRKGNG